MPGRVSFLASCFGGGGQRLSEFGPGELGRSRGGATGAGILELRGDDTKYEFARSEIFWCVRRISVATPVVFGQISVKGFMVVGAHAQGDNIGDNIGDHFPCTERPIESSR